MNENAMQAMMDGMGAHPLRERAETQMTLGKLIERLEAMPKETIIRGLNNPHSYRGYYSELAFESVESTAVEALALCRSAMGEVFEGYKGGDNQMGRNTPVWSASYGCFGKKIMAIRDDGNLEISEDTFK